LVLLGSQVNRLNLGQQTDRLYWGNIAQDLTQQLDAVSTGVHFESAEVMAVTQPEFGTEVMRVAIRDLISRNTRVPLCVFELGIKYKFLKYGHSPQIFFMDFRPWKGAVLPFLNYKPNSRDEKGEFLRVSIARKYRNQIIIKEFIQENENNKEIMKSIISTASKINMDIPFKRFTSILGKDIWKNEILNINNLLKNSDKEN
jgi:hypothetical protein